MLEQITPCIVNDSGVEHLRSPSGVACPRRHRFLAVPLIDRGPESDSPDLPAALLERGHIFKAGGLEGLRPSKEVIGLFPGPAAPVAPQTTFADEP